MELFIYSQTGIAVGYEVNVHSHDRQYLKNKNKIRMCVCWFVSLLVNVCLTVAIPYSTCDESASMRTVHSQRLCVQCIVCTHHKLMALYRNVTTPGQR